MNNRSGRRRSYGASPCFRKSRGKQLRRETHELKSYGSSLSWDDNKSALPTITIGFNTIYAESGQQARELSQAQAITELPVLTSKLSDKQIVPPYMTDPTGTLALWKVSEAPLNVDERDRASKGQLGPARAMHLRVEASIG